MLTEKECLMLLLSNFISALHIDTLFLLPQTTCHCILGVGLCASFYKIPHFAVAF